MSVMTQLSPSTWVGRLNEAGDVRLLVLTGSAISPPVVTQTFHPADVQVDITISSSNWCSALAEVSNRGSIEGRFYIAQAFHNNAEPFARWAGLIAEQNAS